MSPPLNLKLCQIYVDQRIEDKIEHYKKLPQHLCLCKYVTFSYPQFTAQCTVGKRTRSLWWIWGLSPSNKLQSVPLITLFIMPLHLGSLFEQITFLLKVFVSSLSTRNTLLLLISLTSTHTNLSSSNLAFGIQIHLLLRLLLPEALAEPIYIADQELGVVGRLKLSKNMAIWNDHLDLLFTSS